MKRAPRLPVIIVLLLLSLASAFSAASYAAPSGEIITACTDDGLYLLSVDEQNVHIECAAPDRFELDLPTGCRAAAASVFGSTAVALCNDVPNRQLIVYTFDMDSGLPDSFAINRCIVDDEGAFYFSGSGLYLPDVDHPSVILHYSVSGKLIGKHDFGGGDAQIVSGCRSGLHILSDGRLYRCADDSYTLVSGDTVAASACFITDDLLIDRTGNIYRVGDRVTKLFATGLSGASAAASPDGAVYAAVGRVIYRFDGASGRVTDTLTVDREIASLYFCDGYLYAPDRNASTTLRIAADEMNPSLSEPTSPALSPITSDAYKVDGVAYRITRIPASTTFAQFKSNISYSGYQAALFRDGKPVSSGKVGTGMLVVFSAADSYTYELSVIGDITGEGSVNSRDVGELIDRFLGNLAFDGVYLDAADVSGDGVVDLLDLAMLCRMG